MMFSNDKNVETIGQLVEVLKHYIGLQTEYVKLDVVDKVVTLADCLNCYRSVSRLAHDCPYLFVFCLGLWLG